MKLPAWLRRACGPVCGASAPAPPAAYAALAALERTEATIDRLRAEVRALRAEMAAADNPIAPRVRRAERRDA